MILPGCKGIWEGEYLAFWVLIIEGSLCLQPKFMKWRIPNLVRGLDTRDLLPRVTYACQNIN